MVDRELGVLEARDEGINCGLKLLRRSNDLDFVGTPMVGNLHIEFVGIQMVSATARFFCLRDNLSSTRGPVPSGRRLQFSIEHGHRKFVSFPSKKCDFP